MTFEYYDELGVKYSKALGQSYRRTKENLRIFLEAGLTLQQFDHWVETGETPSATGGS